MRGGSGEKDQVGRGRAAGFLVVTLEVTHSLCFLSRVENGEICKSSHFI